MQYFYSQEILDDKIVIREDELIHLAKTLRKQVGDIIYVLDGRGVSYESKIIEIKKKFAELQILNIETHPKPLLQLEIAMAPTKNMARFEWFLEKATEIGVSSFVPIVTRYSERKKIRLDRCERIIVSAAKQSKQFHFPWISEMISFSDFIKNCNSADKAIAYISEDEISPHITKLLDRSNNISICIGPEGGFHPDEVKSAESFGFNRCHLGFSRLRTETAGVYVASVLNARM